MTLSSQRWSGFQLLVLLSQASVFASLSERQLCQHRGDPENPQIFKDGDIVLGGIFSFHSSWKNRQENYTHKPQPLECTR